MQFAAAPAAAVVSSPVAATRSPADVKTNIYLNSNLLRVLTQTNAILLHAWASHVQYSENKVELQS
jgi:hypothetical protein